MAINVVIPVDDRGQPAPAPVSAPAVALGPDAHIGLVVNGKYLAEEILVAVAGEITAAGLAGSWSVHTKPSASAPISAEGHADLLARSRIVLTGVGD